MLKFVSKKWRNWSIKAKFLTSFFIVLMVVSIFNMYLNNNNYAITDQFNHTIENYNKINQLQQLVSKNRRQLDTYLASMKPEDKEAYLDSKYEIKTMIEPLYEVYDSMEIYFSIKSIINSTEHYFTYFDQAIMERENGDTKYYEQYYDGIDILEYSEIYIQELLNLSLDEGALLYNQLVHEAEVARRISLLLILGGFILALILGNFFSNYLVRPIKHLAQRSMLMAQGDLKVESVPIESEDEIGVLAESFNIMSSNIHKYVEDLEEKVEIEKKLHEEELEHVRLERLVEEARYQALQSQIDPHFLFNTLNTISRTAMFENAEKSVKLTQVLSSLFRYRLRQSEPLISLKEDMGIVGQYIYLQKVRFDQRLNYIESIKRSCLDEVIPSFLIQPIVENAIIHGIEPKIEGGTIRIKIYSRLSQTGETFIVIRILDTGIGMDQSVLEGVKNYKTDRRSSIGVGNVYKRFMIASSKKGVFRILSKKGLGTLVEFRFKKGTFDEYNKDK